METERIWENIKPIKEGTDEVHKHYATPPLTPLQQFDICVQKKFCIPGQYPPLANTRVGTRDLDLSKFGRKKGHDFLVSVLEEKIENGGENVVTIDRYLSIFFAYDFNYVFSSSNILISSQGTSQLLMARRFSVCQKNF